MKIILSLRISIFLLFFAVSTAVLGIASIFSLNQVIKMQVVTSAETMQAVGEKIQERIGLVYGRMESTLAAFERADGSGIAIDFYGNPWFGTFVNMMDMDEDIYSSYFGLSDGRFYQVIALGRFASKGSKFDFPIPKEAAYAELRQFPDKTGKMVRRWTFYTSERKRISDFSEDKTDYDPSSRIWYKNAYYTSERMLSRPYKFYMINDLGITLSSRLKNGMDGVFGTDITVGGISKFLDKQKITDNTRLLIYNESDMLLGMSVNSGEGELYKTAKLDNLLSIYDIKDDAVAMYSANRDRKTENRLIEFKSGNEKYIAKTIKLFDDSKGTQYAAIIVPLRDILGNIYTLHYKIMFFVAILAVCSIPLISLASDRISRPLERIIASVDRVRDLNMTAQQFKPSAIKEINRLNSAISHMTETLERYTRYVPKETVQKIIKSGLSTKNGGQKKELSVMSVYANDFQTLRNSMDADKFFHNISDFYNRISITVSDMDGFPLQFYDGSIDAVWNAPATVNNHEQMCILAALECSNLMNRDRLPFMTDDGRRFPASFAVDTGEMYAGNTGASDRQMFTVSGRALDTVRELAKMNSIYGTNLLTTGRMVQKLPDGVVCRWICRADICGQTEDIYEIAGLKKDLYPHALCTRINEQDSEYFARFSEVKLFIEFHEFEKAAALLSECIAERPEDTVPAVMKKLLET